MATPEGRIKARLRSRLNKLPKRYVFMPVQNGMGASTHDYLICVSGCFVSIETKAPGKKMTPRQEIVAQQIREAGGLVFLVDSDEAIDTCLSQLAELTKPSLCPRCREQLLCSHNARVTAAVTKTA